MFHNKSAEETEKELQTSPNGISDAEATKRQIEAGKNVLQKPPKKTLFGIFLEQFKSPIIFILIVAGIFSIIIKSYPDAIFIFIVIAINTIFGTFQEWNSEKSAEKLQNMIRIKTKVFREGTQKEIDSEELVVGDIVLLESGDKVAADLRLIEANDLLIDESILTGESTARGKDTKINNIDTKLADVTNIAFQGTIVTKGRGKGIVIAIAENTEFGKIAGKVLSADDTKSPLVIRMSKFARQISVCFLVIAAILATMMYFKGYKLQEIFQNVVGLTVSSIPEGLTIAMTIVLSVASSEMAKRNVIVKKLSAVESLGSCTVIATDKTGTLTVNEQTAKRITLPSGASAYIKGTGYNDNGSIEFGEFSNTVNVNNFRNIAKLAMLNNEATLDLKKNVHQGDAIDVAFLALGYKMQANPVEKIVDRIPYESKLKYSAVFYKSNDGEETCCTVKGAVEKVMDFCEFMQIESDQEKIDKELILSQAEELAKQGYRVIAVADGKAQNCSNIYNEENIDNKVSKNLTFLGLVSFVDPVREDVIYAVRKCNMAGIKVTMITGDHPLTANAIGERIGITDIHARVSPLEKLKIVENFKNDGEFVAVTGDGVNDSPALKTANIGIAMGSGSDIAKETGQMIITDDNFASIVNGIELGRKAYNNIRKVVYLLLSTGIAEVIIYTISMIFGLPVPLTSIQLLWLNFISDGIQGDALAMEKDTEDVMKQKVKNTKEAIVNKFLISEIAVSAIVMTILGYSLYYYLIKIQDMDVVMARTYLLTFMILLENIHIFNCRSETVSCFEIPLSNNVFLMWTILITSIIQLIIVRVPTLATFFGLTVIPLSHAIALILPTIPLIIAMELFKIIYKKII